MEQPLHLHIWAMHTVSDHEDTSSPLLVRRDWLFIPVSGTVPPEIRVLVDFCETPKTLVSRRPFGHLCPHKDPKGITKEDVYLSLSAVPLHPRSSQVAPSSSTPQAGPRMSHTSKNEIKMWKSPPQLPLGREVSLSRGVQPCCGRLGREQGRFQMFEKEEYTPRCGFACRTAC